MNDPKPLIDALRTQRNAAYDTIAEMYATITVLQSRIVELEAPPLLKKKRPSSAPVNWDIPYPKVAVCKRPHYEIHYEQVGPHTYIHVAVHTSWTRSGQTRV
jgi:hypothetical protein